MYLQVASIHGDGMHLELCMGDDSGELIEGDPYPVMSIRADDEDSKELIVYTASGNLSIPLAEVEKAIEYAKQEVHCESFYDEPADT